MNPVWTPVSYSEEIIIIDRVVIMVVIPDFHPRMSELKISYIIEHTAVITCSWLKIQNYLHLSLIDIQLHKCTCNSQKCNYFVDIFTTYSSHATHLSSSAASSWSHTPQTAKSCSGSASGILDEEATTSAVDPAINYKIKDNYFAFSLYSKTNF